MRLYAASPMNSMERTRNIMKVKTAIYNYFNKIPLFACKSEEQKDECFYLDEHLIDSLGIIEMISTLENDFDIRFEAEHLQSDEFLTVKGLVSMVERMCAEQGKLP